MLEISYARNFVFEKYCTRCSRVIYCTSVLLILNAWNDVNRFWEDAWVESKLIKFSSRRRVFLSWFWQEVLQHVASNVARIGAYLYPCKTLWRKAYWLIVSIVKITSVSWTYNTAVQSTSDFRFLWVSLFSLLYRI